MLLLCNTMYKHCRASICSLSGQMHWMLWPLCSTEKRWPTQCSTEMQISIPYFPGRSAQLSICSKSNIMPMILYLLCITAPNHNAWWPNADRWCRGPLTYCHTWTLEPEKLNYNSCPSHPVQKKNWIIVHPIPCKLWSTSRARKQEEKTYKFLGKKETKSLERPFRHCHCQ